jgi:hypothetical protein
MMSRSSSAVIYLLLTLLLTTDVHCSTLRKSGDEDSRPKIQHRKLLIPSKGSKLIDDQYLIILNDDVKNVDAKVEEILGTSRSTTSSIDSKSLSSEISEVNSFNSSILGFTMTNVSQDSLQILLEDKDVKWIEQVSERMQQG